MKKKQYKPDIEVAGIEYMGEAGVTYECKNAIIRLIQFGDKVKDAIILTAERKHGFLLSINNKDLIGIKSGFSSGYGGTGPSGFSYIIQLLDTHRANIKECEVEINLLERLDNSMLTFEDILLIQSIARPLSNWTEYVFPDDWNLKESGKIWKEFRLIIPYAIIDNRLRDLALSFWTNPDEKLLTGYRRLEDIIRTRSNINEHGAKLFSQALRVQLCWENIDESEKMGRVSLFTGAYMSYRNPRAHRELDDNSAGQLAEFLLLNHLYILETSLVDSKKET